MVRRPLSPRGAQRLFRAETGALSSALAMPTFFEARAPFHKRFSRCSSGRGLVAIHGSVPHTAGYASRRRSSPTLFSREMSVQKPTWAAMATFISARLARPAHGSTNITLAMVMVASNRAINSSNHTTGEPAGRPHNPLEYQIYRAQSPAKMLDRTSAMDTTFFHSLYVH